MFCRRWRGLQAESRAAENRRYRPASYQRDIRSLERILGSVAPWAYPFLLAGTMIARDMKAVVGGEKVVGRRRNLRGPGEGGQRLAWLVTGRSIKGGDS